MTKTLLSLLLAACSPIFAQALNVSVTPATGVRPGGTVTMSLTWVDAATPVNAAGLQWTFSPPPGVTIPHAEIGPVGAQTNKILSCGGTICIAVGSGATSLNATPIPGGPVMTYTLLIPPTATPGAPLTLAISNVMAVDANGNVIPNVTTTPATLPVLFSKYDLNSDGAVNVLDVGIAISQAIQSAPCTTGDVNGDGRCDLADVQLIILVAMGKITP